MKPRMLFLLLLTLAAACAGPESHRKKPGLPEGAPYDGPLAALLPPAPAGFQAAVDVTPRGRGDIFEQINGGSVTYLENGMQDALFATYPRPGDDSAAMEVEVYRFETPAGAAAQFAHLQPQGATPWEGATAVLHPNGVELVAGRVILRLTYNDGPPAAMAEAARALARSVLGKLRGR